MVKSLMLFLVLATSACASHPFNQEWEWRPSRPGESQVEQTMAAQRSEMERIRRENPTWDSHISDDVVVVGCEKVENSITCVGK